MAAQRRAALCMELEGVVRAMGLARAWEIKPLVDGKAVMVALGMTQVPGPACLLESNSVTRFSSLALPCGPRHTPASGSHERQGVLEATRGRRAL